MSEKSKKELIKARKDVKKKFQLLKADIIQSQFERQREFEPLLRPLKELTEKLKTEPAEVKEEPLDYGSFLSRRGDFFSTPTKAKKSASKPSREEMPSTYQKYLLPPEVSFLENESVFEATPVNLSDESDENIRRQLEESRQFLENLPSHENYQAYLNQFDPLPRKYVDESARDTKGVIDNKYGVRLNIDEDTFFIGDSPLSFLGKDIKVKNLTYRGTSGLYELLFKKKPIGYTQKDLDDYMDILKRTNAYRKNYKENQQIHGTAADKYVAIIHPYLVQKGILKETLKGTERSFTKPPRPMTRARTSTIPQSQLATYFQGLKKKGKGLMDLSKNKIDFVYFDDPNELVERLKLLVASKMAGHTGHNNEINSIIEELREANIII